MEEGQGVRYWCQSCEKVIELVQPEMKCPDCDGGFVEEMESGTVPAKKEVVEALPTVNIHEVLGCSVCLEDFEMGTEAKEMPCQHKFHSHCILPWLELHNFCPICRFQLPTEESKNPCESASGVGTVNNDEDNAASSSSDVESTNDNGGNHPGSPILSALRALFANQSTISSSDENIPHSSKN